MGRESMTPGEYNESRRDSMQEEECECYMGLVPADSVSPLAVPAAVVRVADLLM